MRCIRGTTSPQEGVASRQLVAKSRISGFLADKSIEKRSDIGNTNDGRRGFKERRAKRTHTTLTQ